MQIEILQKLDELLSLQQELNVMMLSLSNKPLLTEQTEVWFTKEKVMDELCIAPRTFYRRRQTDNWTSKKSGGRTYYLKSSLLR